MSAGATKVVPPFYDRGLRSAACAPGIALGATILPVFEEWATNGTFMRFGFAAMIAAQLLVIFGPPMVLAAVLARRIPARRPLVFAVAVFMGAFASTTFIVALVGTPTGGVTQVGAEVAYEWPIVVAVITAVSVVIALGVRSLGRAAFGVPVAQSGNLCWRCGYDRGGATITICPECGLLVDGSRMRARGFVRSFDAVQRRGGVLLMLSLIGLLSWTAFRVTTVTIPMHRFFHALDPSGDHRTSWLYVPTGGYLSGRWVESVVYMPLESDPSRCLLVMYLPRGADGGPAWLRGRISLSATPNATPLGTSGTTVSWPDEGNKRVYVDLNQEQMDWVIARGKPPAGLVDAFAARASTVVWSASATGASGPMKLPESKIEGSEYFKENHLGKAEYPR